MNDEATAMYDVYRHNCWLRSNKLFNTRTKKGWKNFSNNFKEQTFLFPYKIFTSVFSVFSIVMWSLKHDVMSQSVEKHVVTKSPWKDQNSSFSMFSLNEFLSSRAPVMFNVRNRPNMENTFSLQEDYANSFHEERLKWKKGYFVVQSIKRSIRGME